MKHTPKPDGTRWMKRNGSVSGPLEETGYQEAYCLTDGHLKWTRDGHFNASRSQHPFDLLYPVTVTPLLDPEPEEPKPPKEVWVNMINGSDAFRGYETEAIADKNMITPSNRLTSHAIRYVLPDEAEEWKLSAQTYKQYCQSLEEQIAARARSDEAELGFSEEEIAMVRERFSQIDCMTWGNQRILSMAEAFDECKALARDALRRLDAISQHRSKKP